MAHTLLDSPARAEVTEAARVALRNFEANRTALARSQPWLDGDLPAADDLTWVFARDGFLTGVAPARRGTPAVPCRCSQPGRS